MVLLSWFSAVETIAQPYTGGSGDGFAQVELQRFSTSIDIPQDKLVFQIYPNPVKIGSVVHLKFKEAFTGTLAVHTLAGHKVFSKSIRSTNEYDLNISNINLYAGIYTLHLKNRQEIWVRKLVVQ